MFYILRGEYLLAQYNSDSIKICQDTEGKLKALQTSRYNIYFANGEIVSLVSN